MSIKRAQRRNEIRRAYSEFTNIFVEIEKDKWPDIKTPDGLTRVFRNNQFVVQIFDNEIDPFNLFLSIKVMVRHNTGQPVVQWAHLQDIKNQIFGEETLAIQYLPPQSKLVDQANMYWFFINKNGE